MNKKAINTVKKYNMLSKGDRVLVAVSGGADSMALLEFFISIKDKYDLNLCAAHIEHGIRGEESLNDALFVKEYCEKSGVKLYMKSINAPYLAKKADMGVEEYSRQARYDFFSTIPCDKIATAHNLTDNAETLLFRLARGTGLKGACAIPPLRDKIIRPFIEISSDEIRAWCNDNNIAYRIDSTNKDDTYSRNLIRLQMLPLFQRLNNGYLENINDFISDVNDDYSFIMNEAQKAYNISVVNNEIELNKLNLLDNAIKKRVIKLYFENNNLNLDRIHLQNINKITQKSGKIQIKNDLYAISAKGKLRIANLKNSPKLDEIVTEILNINEFSDKNIDFYCDCDKIIGSVTIRKRLPGDSLKPAGRNVSKTLKKLFNEAAYPIEKRNGDIVVCDDKGIIGIIGLCADDRVKKDCNTENVFIIKLPSED